MLKIQKKNLKKIERNRNIKGKKKIESILQNFEINKSEEIPIHESEKNDMAKSLNISQNSISEDKKKEIKFEMKEPKKDESKEEKQMNDNRVNYLENIINELKLKLQEKDNIINEDKKQINELNNTILELKDEIE